MYININIHVDMYSYVFFYTTVELHHFNLMISFTFWLLEEIRALVIYSFLLPSLYLFLQYPLATTVISSEEQ